MPDSSTNSADLLNQFRPPLEVASGSNILSSDPLRNSLDLPSFSDRSSFTPIAPVEGLMPLLPICPGYPISDFSSGYFTVGTSGQVGVDYLFDGGSYEGELGIFSLKGLEQFDPGSNAFIQEVVRRILSSTTEGHLVIDDHTDAARFTDGAGWDGNFNAGDYLGVKTVAMNPGDTFGVALLPHGSFQQALGNTDLGGNQRPLFSLATANPNQGFQFGQIADVTGNGSTFALEDLRLDANSDRDYNDMIFQVRGAIGVAASLDEVIAKDWRGSDFGQALLSYIAPYDAPETTKPVDYHFPTSHQPLIGIIDTGFAGNNPDIDYSRIILGRDYVDGDINPLLNAGEGNEHGTHILGIIGATQNNGIGIDGINDQAPLWVGRAIGSGKWAESLVEFVNQALESNQPNAVVNLSLDLTQRNPDGSVTTRYEFTPEERAALEYARQSGVLIVAAAGNDGDVMSVLGQASQEFDNILTVGAADGMNRADYSSYGYGLDILAPGGTSQNGILSTVADGVGILAGASVATAHVTGAISQIWAANPNLSYRQVIELAKLTATDLSNPNWDTETGAGFLNIAAATELAKVTQPQSHTRSTLLIPTTWGGEGLTIPVERAVADQFNGKHYEWNSYSVQSGDTLGAIALRTMGGGTPPHYNFIAQKNGIANSDLIYVGQQILIPREVAAPSVQPSPNLNNTVGYDGTSTHQTYINTFNRDGVSTTLGSPTNNVHPWGNGYIQDFSGGSDGRGGIMKSNANDNSYWVGSDFWNKFLETGGAAGILDYPTSDRHSANGGQRQDFQGGAILKSNSGIFPVYGGIGGQYLNVEGGQNGRLGFPKSGEIGIGNGVIIQNFENGRIVYGDGPTRTEMYTVQPSTSVTINGNVINGSFYPVFNTYRGTLGNPVSGTTNYSSGVSYQLFENGSIVSSKYGTFPLYGGIRQTYLNTGGLNGWLGVPTSAETSQGNGVIKQTFEYGYIIWNGSKAVAYRTGNGTGVNIPSVPVPSNPGTSVPPLHSNPTSANPLRDFRHPLMGAGSVTQGANGSTSHYGRSQYAVDYGVPIGTPVYAMRSGRVVSIQDPYPDTGGGQANKDRVNWIIIEHDGGYRTAYLHLQQGFRSKVGIQVGTEVSAGQLIGYSGNSGWSTGPHLHAEVHKGNWGNTVPFQIG